MFGTRLELEDDLTTTATGRYGLVLQDTVCASGGNRQHPDGDIGILGSGREKGRPLGTET